MSQAVRNIGKSVRDRLTTIAKKEGKSLPVIAMLYAMERFLYRLSLSESRDSFILKGGLLLYSLTQTKTRPTQDIDFLAAHIKNDLEYIASRFAEVLALDEEPDGVNFQTATLVSSRIREDAKYEGVRIRILATIDTMKIPLQFDIGFGDVIVPTAVDFDFPTFFENMGRPNIRVYSIESVIAEKFEAMISLSELNTRMKDFYDIHLLLQSYDFDGRVLQEAIYETFQRRGTIVEREPVLFSEEFAIDAQRTTVWGYFLKRTSVTAINFATVMAAIVCFIKPIYDALVDEHEFFQRWSFNRQEWHAYEKATLS